MAIQHSIEVNALTGHTNVSKSLFGAKAWNLRGTQLTMPAGGLKMTLNRTTLQMMWGFLLEMENSK
jgi:hypothetical protein